MSSPGSRVTSFQLPEDMIARLEREASRLTVSRSALVRQAVNLFFARSNGSQTTAEGERDVA